MTKRISKGICALCQGELSRANMTRHLEACQRKAADAERSAGRRAGRTMKHFHLVVEGRDLPNVLDASARAHRNHSGRSR